MAKLRDVCLFGLLGSVFACDSMTGPEGIATTTGDDQLTVVTSQSGIAALERHVLRHGAVPPETFELAFWAVYGRDTRVVIWYDGRSEKFLDFRVPRYALRERPDGSRLSRGDSVRIVVTIDPDRYVVRFSPSGLQFNLFNPPLLTLSYVHADRDFDGDGDVDGDDEAIRASLGVWWQEGRGEPWYSWLTLHDRKHETITSLLRHFSNYTLSW